MYPFFDLIPKYFPELTDKQKERLLMLWDIYHFWNSKVNVISRKDIDDLYLRHVLHSLSIARFFHFDVNSTILDIGTGGGFPGIPLSIYFENVRISMVDSIGKKIHVVQEIINNLKLSNATARQIRAEDMNERFDFVTCRAVADITDIIKWTSKSIEAGTTASGLKRGLVCLKGGELNTELSKVRWNMNTLDISSIYQEEFFQTKKIVYLWK